MPRRQRTYSEAAHDRALVAHDHAWDVMHDLGVTDGRDSDAYRQARSAVVEAARQVRLAARRPPRSTFAKRSKGRS